MSGFLSSLGGSGGGFNLDTQSTSSGKTGDAFSRAGDIDGGISGDFIVGGSKNSLLTTALIIAGLIVIASIVKRGKK